MPSWIDGGLYPDTNIPENLTELPEQVDFLARLCAAWDFGRLLTSPAYHLLRRWHNLPELPYLGQELAYIRDDPNLAYV
jgi:hypothetical protein